MTKKTRAKARRALLTLSLVLVVAFAAVGGTIAWLQDETQTVTNTFSPSNINVDLKETDSADTDTDANNNDYQIIPGTDITKDPKVSASANVDYFVFVKVTEANWPTWTETDGSKKVYYEIADGWTELTGDFGTGVKVYYKEVAAGTSLTEVSVLKGDKVNVSETVTKEELATITDDNKPTVTVQAYAIQQAGENGEKFAVATAWTTVSATAAAN